jgi:hypothetical protein
MRLEMDWPTDDTDEYKIEVILFSHLVEIVTDHLSNTSAEACRHVTLFLNMYQTKAKKAQLIKRKL